jgi:hypothetical protein
MVTIVSWVKNGRDVKNLVVVMKNFQIWVVVAPKREKKFQIYILLLFFSFIIFSTSFFFFIVKFSFEFPLKKVYF